MPKIIPELREALINAARSRILNNESHDLTIREVARDCETAVGTVYNYFSSKDELLAAVMLEDWFKVIGRIDSAVGESESFDEGVRGIDAALRGFVEMYRPTWKSYAGGYGVISEYHPRLIVQIESAVKRLAVRHSRAFTEDEITVVAEMLLVISQRTPAELEKALPIIRKII